MININENNNSGKSYSNFFEKFRNFFIKTSNLLDKVGKFVVEHEKEISYFFLKFPEDIQSTIEMIAKYEWTLDRTSPFSEITKFIQIYKSQISEDEKQIQVDTTIMNLLDDQKIHSIFDSIYNSSCIKSSRIAIVEEIEFAYDNEKYYSANCLLVTLIQGIIIDSDSSIEWASGSRLSKSLSENMDEFCEVLTFKVFKNAFYAPFNPKTRIINSSISRDAILHGYNVDFGNKKVFLKLLLLVYDICLSLSEHRYTNI